MNKIFKYSLMLLAVGAAFVSCKDDEDSFRVEPVSGAQVYFSNELPSEMELPKDKDFFTIQVMRIDSTGSLTVPINATLEDGSIYQIPATVTFANGAKTADIVVSFDRDKIVYGKYETITLAVGNEELTTPYGSNFYSVSVGLIDWSEWKPWNEAGTANYIYSGVYFEDDDPGLPFSYRQNLLNPNLYQLRLEHWGRDVTVVLNYDKETGIVTFPAQYTGVADAEGYGKLYVSDYNAYMVASNKVPGIDFDPLYGSFDEENGIITVPVFYYVSAGYFGADYESIYIDGYTRADVSCAISYVGKLTTPDDKVYFIANVQLGADATVANVALVPGDLTEEVQAQIIAGEYENMVQVEESGDVRFPAEGMADGKYTLVVVSFLDEEAREIDTATFKYEAVASAWTSLGIGSYTEDAIGPLFAGEEDDPASMIATYEVEIQANNDQPGLYRLVNPYGEAYPLNEEGDWDDSQDYYLEVNAVDPDGVFIEAQNMGINWGAGPMLIYSLGAYYLDNGSSFEDVKAEGNMGTLKDGVITFPKKGILVGIGTKFYLGNQNGAYKIVLPEAYNASGKTKAQKLNKKSGRHSLVRTSAHIKPMLKTGDIMHSYIKHIK